MDVLLGDCALQLATEGYSSYFALRLVFHGIKPICLVDCCCYRLCVVYLLRSVKFS